MKRSRSIGEPKNSPFGWDPYYAHRYDQAIIELHKALDLDPNNWTVHLMLGHAYVQQGKFAAAIAALGKARQLEDQISVSLAALGAPGYAVSGRRVEARNVLDELIAPLPAPPRSRIHCRHYLCRAGRQGSGLRLNRQGVCTTLLVLDLAQS